MNTQDDWLTDDSLGFVVDANNSGTVNAGDVAFGIAWLDDVNGNSSVAGRAYIVYSVEFATVASDGSATYKPTTVSGYKLDDILGVDINDNSIAAVVERTGAPVVADPFYPKTDSDYSFGSSTFPNVTPAQMIDDINGTDADGLMAGASFLFAVGIVNPTDYFVTGALTWKPSISKWQTSVDAGLSVSDPGVLNPLDFKPLQSGSGYQAVAFSADQTFEGGSSSPLVPPPFVNGRIRTFDSGNYNVNYVPEPTSLAGLLGAGLTALGIAGFRRRRRK
jgi:hypothetical protein